ncbi:MAG: hypothetical protein ACPGVH_01925 [Chitinophagales bacterium]
MRKYLYILLFCICSVSGFAQKKNNKTFNAEGDNAIYTKEWGLGLRFHTNGYSAFFEHVWIRDIKRRKLIQANFFIYSDFRERKIETIYNTDPKSFKYYYGKVNNFYALTLLYGNRRVIANKSETSGVKLSLSYMGGISLGFLKPYYLRFVEQDAFGFQFTDEGYTEENREAFLNDNPTTSKVFGAGSFGKGFNKIQFLPGLQAKVGLNFDFARKSNLVTSLEVGTQIDVFYKKVKTYITRNNKPYILNIYLSMQIGKRN